MPWYDFICEVCETPKRAWSADDQKPPRFCSRKCHGVGLSKSKTGKSLKPPKYIITEIQAAQIRRVYAAIPEKGAVRDLAKRLGLPRWKVSKFAAQEGLVGVQRKEPPWSERELHILEQGAHLCAAVLRRRLLAGGFRRTETGIVLKRRRMRFLQNLRGQSATTLALCFGVDAKTVIRYIDKGYLRASKRGTARTLQQGGDEWFIKDAAIKEFVQAYPEYVDFRKVDKIWFIDLLAGSLSSHPKDSEGAGYAAAQY